MLNLLDIKENIEQTKDSSTKTTKKNTNTQPKRKHSKTKQRKQDKQKKQTKKEKKNNTQETKQPDKKEQHEADNKYKVLATIEGSPCCIAHLRAKCPICGQINRAKLVFCDALLIESQCEHFDHTQGKCSNSDNSKSPSIEVYFFFTDWAKGG